MGQFRFLISLIFGKLEVVAQLRIAFSYIFERERGDDGVMGYTTVPITS